MPSTIESPGLSLTGGLGLLFKLVVLAPPQLLFSLIRCYTLAVVRGISLRHWAKCALFRFALHSLSPRQVQFMSPPTLSTYKSWLTGRQSRAAARCKRDSSDKEAAFLASRLKLDTEPLPDGRSSLLWIGDRHRATKFVLFLHGGGYIAPALPGHMEWCTNAYLRASPAAAGKGSEEEVAVAVLQYTLCPDAQYPDQLQQAVDALAHLFASGRVRPGNLVLGGDSAGGNLTAQVLGHLLHPHPTTSQLVLEEPLAGVFMASPWLSVRSDCWASVARNQNIDMISARSTDRGGGILLEGAEGYEAQVKEKKGWAMPMDLEDPEAWFRGLDRMVKEVYVTVGEQEILRDQGIAFGDAVRRGNPGVTVKLEVAKHEAHDWILLEGEKGMDGDATKRMSAWFKGVFWP
ncbi:Alpha/Beta hydrolase protein [Chaetomidium leptoderma]|uniref:Alpha/Beta hydrolase protein n=1 Tax=Chaetomidium leptoderma TaxID=669021 RepID=A0AAN6ZX41_9PEZI|nr:Alpha/Beta hydrolase protein [Chaetomidium leptoderma]